MKKLNINIIIPSYNESRNISMVIQGIRRELPNSKIIFVDDSSELENKKINKIIKKFKNIDLISRGKKLGRGSAVIEGFRFGLKYKNAQYFFEMDSDLAHEPKQFKRFIKKILEKNVDLVIGSRYMQGGKIINVSIVRKILSRIINRFLYLMLGIKLTDYTDGFRLYKRNAVEFIVKSKIKSTGFITLSEIVYKLNRNGFKIDEVPVSIYKRKHGKSTMGISELTRSLIFILRMKVEEEVLNNFKFR